MNKIDNEGKVIMGIDPGTNKMGYGVIRIENRSPCYVTMGHIDLSKLDDSYTKLRQIYERVEALMDLYQPTEVAFEAPFYGENVQSMLKLGRAQGVAIAAALAHKVTIFEYAPRKVKVAITGEGAASKEQVAQLLKTIFHLRALPKSQDATDGLAVALCHYYQSTNRFSSNDKGRGWESFIKNNPDKVRTEIKAKKKVKDDTTINH